MGSYYVLEPENMSLDANLFLLLFIIFIGISIGSGALLILSTTPIGQSLIKHRGTIFSLFLACIATYLISLLAAFVEPYWFDNGVRVNILFPEHFVAALFTTPIFQLVIIPAVLFGIKTIHHLRQR